MEWALMVVGMLLVAALWDVGRRYAANASQNAALSALSPRLEALEKSHAELLEMRGDVASHGTELQQLRSKLEMARAQAQRPKAGFPRGIG